MLREVVITTRAGHGRVTTRVCKVGSHSELTLSPDDLRPGEVTVRQKSVTDRRGGRGHSRTESHRQVTGNNGKHNPDTSLSPLISAEFKL